MFIGVQMISAAFHLASPAEERSVERTDAVALRVDSGATLVRQNLWMRDAGESVIGTLTLTLSAKQVVVASTMLELPRGTRVLAMTLAHGDEAFVGRTLSVEEAHRRFVETVEPPAEIVVPRPPSQRDPAVLELEGSGASERLRLTVFPVSASAPATVTVTFATPRFDRIDVYGGGSFRDSLLRTELARASGEDVALAAEASRISAGRALYAAPQNAAPSAGELASRFDAVLPTLARCAAVDDADTVQHVVLRVDVDEHGRTWLRSAEGAGSNLVVCLRQVIETVRFADEAATSLTTVFDVVPTRSEKP